MRMLFVLFAILFADTTTAQPVQVVLPERNAWCVTSQPIKLEADSPGGRFGDLVFYELYRRLETAALKSGLASIGVPYLANIKEEAPLPVAVPATPSSAAKPEANPKLVAPNTPPPKSPPRYSLRVCSNVPNATPVPVAALKVEAVRLPGGRVFAVLCSAADDTPCRQQLQKQIESELKLSPQQLANLEWRVSQSIDGRADAASLLASLTDTSIRRLTEGTPAPAVPRDKLVVWTAP